jgi:hypothetical protein
MRGCCHRPGVDGAGDGAGCCCCFCGVGVLAGVDVCCGVRLSFGSVIGEVLAGVAGFCTTKLLEEDEERTRAVVDMFVCLRGMVGTESSFGYWASILAGVC